MSSFVMVGLAKWHI